MTSYGVPKYKTETSQRNGVARFTSKHSVTFVFISLTRSPLLPSTPQPKPVDHVNVESVTIYKWYDLWYYFNAIWASLPGLVASYIGFNIINVSNVGLTRLYVRCLILFIVLSSLPAVLAVVGKKEMEVLSS